jgi:transcription termination/antitermination protein NusA
MGATMNADLLALMEFWEREKGISREELLSALRTSLVSTAKKAVGRARGVRIVIDSKSGDVRAFARFVVSEKVLSKHDQISVLDARRLKADARVGEELEIEVTPTGLGRTAAQYTRQALMRQTRKEEKSKVLTEFKDRVANFKRR